jgi:8-amino-7-oxononanoate synthase
LGISSNCYLWSSFTKERALDNFEFGGSSCSSRLLTGNSTSYTQLEDYLAQLYNREAALVINSGYHANIGILPALMDKNDLVLADKLVHASIIDGLKLTEAKVIRYRHNDLEQLQDILEKGRTHYKNVIIVTESVFSMNGDTADIQKLVELKNKYDALLYVDEAHAVGVYGKQGLGLCDTSDTTSHIDFIVGTFGKALASQGAFVICDRIMKVYLVNTMRSLIFTTALPPISLQWTLYVMNKIKEMENERVHLALLSEIFRKLLMQHGYETLGCSQIVPLIIGDNMASIKFSDHLMRHGIFALPVRPPTVPEGTSRIRFSLTADMVEHDIAHVIDVIKTI